MQARTIIDKIDIDPQTGIVGVRMRKQIIADNGEIISNDYHRTTIEPDADSDVQMASVNAHLSAMGFPAVADESVDVLGKVLTPLSPLRAKNAAAKLAAKPRRAGR